MSEIRRVRFLLGQAFLAAATLSVSASVFAQSTGGILGKVQDATAGVLPGVSVTATHESTGGTRSVTTNTDGLYQFRSLPVGKYAVVFELPGFRSVRQEGIPVEAAVNRTLNVTMEVGGVEETVTVSARAEIVQTDTAAVAYQVSSQTLEQIPSGTRNFTHLLSTTAGVSSDLPPVAVNDTGSISPSVNGARTTSNSLMFNGIDITSLLSNTGTLDDNVVPAPETIEEVKLQTSLFDASVGRAGGGNFQIVTKSGANLISGSGYAFVQHESFANNEYFAELYGLDKPKARRYEEGFNVGGPLAKDKVFVYGSYQRTDAETGFVPSAQSRSLLPQALSLISGPRTPENLVAAFQSLNPTFNLNPSQISPVALAILNTVNPVTGDFIIPGPSGPAAGRDPTVAIGSFGSIGGDPLLEFRQIIPGEFQQDQLSTKLDVQMSDANRLSGTFFYSKFPSENPFPDPTTLASPFPLLRDNEGIVLSVTDTHVGTNVINDLRVGYFMLDNTRRQTDEIAGITNASVGVFNPAVQYDDRAATTRLGHYVNRPITWSWGGPNDSYNNRFQDTFQIGDTVSWLRGNHNLRFGGDFKQHYIDTNLPEEQATEFEKIENFQQFLLGFTSEADTQFGFTEKSWKARDIGVFFLDDWRVSDQLTVNLGVRWDWYGWPSEDNGLFGNFIGARVANPNDVQSGFVVPSNVGTTGFDAVDQAIAATARADSRSTMNGEDLNNFQPRVGFAWLPSKSSSNFVIRGGYGIYNDRLTAAFINTVFSNYPILREIEVTVPSRTVPIGNAFTSQTNPATGAGYPFNQYLPMSIRFSSGAYGVRDGLNNVAETFELRTVDPDLVTPSYHQFNIGFQLGLGDDMAWEVRYNGSVGRDLLEAVSFNQSWDLNDPATPQYVKDRLTAAFRAGGGAASSQDPGALGYGYVNPATGRADNNYGPGGRLIPNEARVSYLGIHDVEALLMRNAAWNSIYHGLQTTFERRFADNISFHLAYTYSQSTDNFSSDPGSTAGGGRPDVPNTGFVVENDSRNVDANRARSDFDRPHRFVATVVYKTPESLGTFARNWQIAAYGQFQSGRPFSVFEAEPTKVYRPGFARLDFAPGANLGTLAQQGSDEVEEFFNADAVVGSADGLGDTPRNGLRGPSQKRVDLGISRLFSLGGRASFEIRVDIFNLFNWANFDLPVNDFGNPDFGSITNTIGGPRIGQVGFRFLF
jgi:hypothetical protein